MTEEERMQHVRDAYKSLEMAKNWLAECEETLRYYITGEGK